MFDDARPGLMVLFSNLGHLINISHICVLFYGCASPRNMSTCNYWARGFITPYGGAKVSTLARLQIQLFCGWQPNNVIKLVLKILGVHFCVCFCYCVTDITESVYWLYDSSILVLMLHYYVLAFIFSLSFSLMATVQQISYSLTLKLHHFQC